VALSPPTVEVGLTLRYGPFNDPGTEASTGVFDVRFTPLSASGVVVTKHFTWEQFPSSYGPGEWVIDVSRTVTGLAPGTWRVEMATPLWRTSCEAELKPGNNLVHFRENFNGCLVRSLGFPGD